MLALVDCFLCDYRWYRRLCGGTWRQLVVEEDGTAVWYRVSRPELDDGRTSKWAPAIERYRQP